MELRHERIFDVKERAARRWLIPLLVAVVAVGLPAVWFGPRLFSRFQEARLLRQGRAAMETDHFRAAILLRRVLSLNHDNADANRALAELAEKYVPNEALVLRERVCRLAPESFADARAWALAALRFGQPAQGEDAFELMKKLSPLTASDVELGARIALAAGRLDDARAGFARVLELDPGNEANELELAALDLRSPNAATRERARETLQRLRIRPGLRHAALRPLVADALDRASVAEALALGKEFVSDPAATFQDRVQYLGVLRAAENPSGEFISLFQRPETLSIAIARSPAKDTFVSGLSDLQREARENPANVAALLAFLNTQGLALIGCEWAASLPREVVSVPPIAPVLADSYRLTVDWPRLEEFLARGEWDQVDYLRLAFSALVLREKGDRAGSAAQWMGANKLADYRPEKLAALERMASAWGWAEEWEDLVWTIADSKRPRQALQALVDFYATKRDTHKMFSVCSRLLEMDPADETTRKNWSRLSLLLKNDKYRTGTMVQELYQKHRDDPEVACTYALLLHVREKDGEALDVLERLGPEMLRTPRVAGYYSVLLFAKNRKKEAAEFVARAREGRFLPEEQELVDHVRRLVD